MRLMGQSALIEERRVWLPEEAPWLTDFLKEVLAFPNAKHDDQVDSLELFLRFMRNPRGLARVGGRPNPVRPNPTRRNFVRDPGYSRPSDELEEDRFIPSLF